MWRPAQPPTPDRIRDAFGVDAGPLRPHPGGYEADAFTDGRWFVKLWRQQPDSDAALALTADLAARGLPVPAALRAVDGGYTADHDGRRYALFPFVEGRPATWDDAEALGAALRGVHAIDDLDLPRTTLDEPWIDALRARADHPWIGTRRAELLDGLDRLAAAMDRARATDAPHVVCHHDLFPHNVLVDDRGRVTALLDWGQTLLAPREHDVFAGVCGPDPVRYLRAYGADDLDPVHLEYARLARSLRDLAARILDEVDREGVDTWGFDGLRRAPADLRLAAPFCRDRRGAARG